MLIRITRILSIVIMIFGLVSCGIVSKGLSGVEQSAEQSTFKQTYSIGPIVDNHQELLLDGSRVLSGMEAGPRVPFVQSQEYMVVQVDPEDMTMLMESIQSDLQENLRLSGAKITGSSGFDGRANPIAHFSYSYSDGLFYGVVNVWGLQTEGTQFIIISQVTESLNSGIVTDEGGSVSNLPMQSDSQPAGLITKTPILESGQDISTLTPTPWMDIEYPADMRTGIEEIDLVIDVVMSQDVEAKIDLVRFSRSACTATVEGLGGPPKCNPGEMDGTIVESFPVSYGEGVQIRADDISKIFDFTIRGLYAVYRVPEDAYEEEYWPAGVYAIIFTSEDGGHSHTISIYIEDGEIVRLGFDMGGPPFDHIWERSDSFILPPSTLENPSP